MPHGRHADVGGYFLMAALVVVVVGGLALWNGTNRVGTGTREQFASGYWPHHAELMRVERDLARVASHKPDPEAATTYRALARRITKLEASVDALDEPFELLDETGHLWSALDSAASDLRGAARGWGFVGVGHYLRTISRARRKIDRVLTRAGLQA